MLLALVTQQALAVGVADNFTVERVRVDRSGKGYVQFTQPLTVKDGPLACASRYPKTLAFEKILGHPPI